MIERIRHFLMHLLHLEERDERPVLRFIIRQIKIIRIVARGFTEANIQLRASALSFFSLLAIVPVLAMVFGISKGFGLESFLKQTIEQQLSENQEIVDTLLEFVDNYLGRFNGGFVTVIGLTVLFWSVMKVFGNIESSFNNIWQIKKSRMFTRKFTDYISLIIIAPILLLVNSSVTVSLLPSISEKVPFLQQFDQIITMIASLISLLLIWVVFTLLYIVIPNTKVRFIPAMIAGILAGSLFQLLQWGYVNFQSLLSGYSVIYGTFAALPLFMLWLNFSWLIVLFGAEVSFAYQNKEHYEQEAEGIDISPKQRRMLTLLVAQVIVRNFVDGKRPLKAAEIADLHDLPVRLVRDIIYDLNNAGIINETIISDVRETAYQPALDPARISISYVFNRIDHLGHNMTSINGSNKEMRELNAIIDAFEKDIQKSPKNILLKDL